MSEYFYEAALVAEATWMVKRSKPDGTWDEALIKVETADKEVAIQAAIKRDSWA